MKHFFLLTLLFAVCLTVQGQNVRVLTDTYKAVRVDGDVWLGKPSDNQRLLVQQVIPNTVSLCFAPNSYARLRDDSHEDYKVFQNIDTLCVKYAFELNHANNQPPTYEGLYDAAVSLRNQSDDTPGTMDLVSFNIEQLEANKKLEVNIAKKDREGDTWREYAKSKAKSFKKKEVVNLFLRNLSDEPLFIDGLISQEGMLKPVSLVRNLESSVSGPDYIIIPPKDHIVILTDVVVWSKISVSIISSTEAFVITADPFVPDSFTCITEKGTNWSVFRNKLAF